MKKYIRLRYALSLILLIAMFASGALLSACAKDAKNNFAQNACVNTTIKCDARNEYFDLYANLIGAKSNSNNQPLKSSANLGDVDQNGNVLKNLYKFSKQNFQTSAQNWEIGNLFFNSENTIPIEIKINLKNYSKNQNFGVKIIEVNEQGNPISALANYVNKTSTTGVAKHANEDGTLNLQGGIAVASILFTPKQLALPKEIVVCKLILKIEITTINFAPAIIPTMFFNSNGATVDINCDIIGAKANYDVANLITSQNIGTVDANGNVKKTISPQNLNWVCDKIYFNSNNSTPISFKISVKSSNQNASFNVSIIECNVNKQPVNENSSALFSVATRTLESSINSSIITFTPKNNIPINDGKSITLILNVIIEENFIKSPAPNTIVTSKKLAKNNTYELPCSFDVNGVPFLLTWFKDAECTKSLNYVINHISEDTIIYGKTSEFPLFVPQNISQRADLFSGEPQIAKEEELEFFISNLTNVFVTKVSTIMPSFALPPIIKVGETKYNVIGIASAFVNNVSYSCLSQNVLESNIEYPITITQIGDNAFRNCNLVKTIKLPQNLNYIGNNAFYGCNNLATINLPETINTIGSNAFGGCGLLNFDHIPANVATINKGAFEGCESLVLKNGFKDLTTIQIIEESAFKNCLSLKFNALPTNLKVIEKEAFFNCVNLEINTLPQNLTSIKEKAFEGCTSAMFVAGENVLPTQINEIYSNSFDANKLKKSSDQVNGVFYLTDKNGKHWIMGSVNKNISVPLWHDEQNVKGIASNAFMSVQNKTLSNLQQISLPKSITILGNMCFANNINLIQIIINSSTPPTLQKDVFSGCDNLDFEIQVAFGTINLYSSVAGWKALYDLGKIVDITRANAVVASKQVLAGTTYNLDYEITEHETLNKYLLTWYTERECINAVSYNFTPTNNLTLYGKTSRYILYSPESQKLFKRNSLTSINSKRGEIFEFYVIEGTTNIWITKIKLMEDPNNPTDTIMIAIPPYIKYMDVTYTVVGFTSPYINQCAFNWYDTNIFNNIDFPITVTQIGDYAFTDMYDLTTITLPSNITTIGNNAFLGSGLTSITINSTNPPTLGTDVFPIELQEIKVPKELVETYKNNSFWKPFANIII
ncbi:MAG: leucine-rich repeat domain-containing protein [Clostridia bacterium]